MWRKFLLVALIVGSGCVSSRADLLSWWPLDGNSTDAAGPNVGTWNGTAIYSSSVTAPSSTQAGDMSNAVSPKRFVKAGAGIDFDGATAFSVAAWIRGSAQDSTIMGDMLQGGTYRGWEMHVGTTANGGSSTGVTIWLLNTYPGNAIQVSSSVNVLNGAWRHLAFTYDGSRTASGVKIYVDGAEVSGAATLNSLTGTIANGAGAELNLGSRQNGANHTFTGQLDEAAVFNHALSAAEVAQVRSSGVGSLLQPPGLLETDPRSAELVLSLTNAEVVFSRDVAGVDASDFLVNGTPASALVVLSASRYRFFFPQPAVGSVNFTWAAGHGIQSPAGGSFLGTGWSVLLNPSAPPSAVHISEFLAENVSALEDEDHDTPDWIEVFNPGPARMDLAGWSLTDDAASAQKWQFPPSTVLHAGDFLVVFASGKDRATVGAPLHTNFKLAERFGYLALRNAEGALVQVFGNYPEQEGNVAFGPMPGSSLADAENAWRYFLAPTPNAASTGVNLPASAIRGVSHNPVWPSDADDLVLTAQLAAVPGPVTAATVFYRVNFESEISVPMTAGPNGYVAVIPASAAGPGDMVRWRFAVTAGGLNSRWPVNDNTSALLPLYLGTTIQNSAVASQLPIYEVFVSGYAAPPSAAGPYHAADSDGGARGAFAWAGQVYDNVQFRIKGSTSRYLFKRSHRVEFNAGHSFQWAVGEPSVRELNLNSEYVDPAYSRQFLSLWMQRAAGVGGAPHFPVRVQMNGAFWQLAFHTLAADKDLLHSMELNDRGALYKQVGQLLPGSPEKENRTWESNADYQELANGINESRPLAQRVSALMDLTELATVINYLAVARLTQEADDVWANMVLYCDSEGSQEWRPVPFDLNLSFGQLFHDGQTWNTVVHATMDNNKSHPLYGTNACRPQYPNNPAYNNWWNRLYDVVIQNTATRSMLLRRLRTLLDQFFKPPGTPYSERPVESELDAHWARIQQEAEMDRGIWGWPPVNNTAGSFGVYGLGNVPPGQAVADIKSLYLDPRRSHFYTTHSINNTGVPLGISNGTNAGIPEAQPATPAITFGVVESSPPSGNQDEEFIQLVNPNAFAVDVSGWRLEGGVTDTLDPGTVIPPGGSLYLSPSVVAFRERLTSPKGGESLFVQGDYSGHLSNQGETLTLVNAAGNQIGSMTYPGMPSVVQQWLAVSELAYAPTPDGAAEYIELVNLSPTLTLDLTGVHFSAGVDFTFTGSAVTSLAPGARVLVVRDLAAFLAVYGSGLPVAGEFASNTRLDNSGERLKLEDALNNTIFDFTYSPGEPWPGEGAIVLANPATGDFASQPEHWRLSVALGGSPGEGDAYPFTGGEGLVEYATGGNPQLALSLSPGNAEIAFIKALGADDAFAVLEISPDMSNWTSGADALEKIESKRLGGSVLVESRYRISGPAVTWRRVFARVQVTLP